MRRLVEEARARAEKILTEKRNELEILTRALIEYETLTKEEMEKVLRGEKLDKLQSSPSAPLKLPEALQAVDLSSKTGANTANTPPPPPKVA